MGAHTIVRFALEHPERVAGAVIITPAFEPGGLPGDKIARYDRLSAALRADGVEGFVEAYDLPPGKWEDTIRTVLRQRLSTHEDLEAVADALRVVPRSEPFTSWGHLEELDMPAVVVASRDEADPEHPLAVGERYASLMPRARLVTEEPGSSPLAWQGGQLSRVIEELAAEVRA
jgi:pimeloyl-ACP methyl ester carboxylesterase